MDKHNEIYIKTQGSLHTQKVKGKWIVSKINYDVRFMYDSGVADCLKDFIDNPFNFI